MTTAPTLRRLAQLSMLVIGLALLTLPAFAQQEAKPAKPEPKPEPAKATTLDHLNAAYSGESNAHARYVEFAKKADEEGYGQVASLFRAAVRSEEIHARNHAEVISKLGGTPKADLQKPEVKSTKENLEAAFKGEAYERDTMYPDFIKAARAENNRDAVRTFNQALSAETEHAKFYKEALDNLDAWKAGKKDFFVCPVCGYTVSKITFEKCPVCFTPKDKYEKVS